VSFCQDQARHTRLEKYGGVVSGLMQAFVRERFLPEVRALSVAFIYQDAETHRQATAAYELLLQELEEGAGLNATWWRTSLLGDPKLSRVAARAIGSSDLIVLSLWTEQQTSASLTSWIESWPLPSDRPVGLVALFQPSAQGLSDGTAWDDYLREFTARRHIVYLPGSLFTTPNWDNRPMAHSEITQSRITEPYQHWGLNE
jgi:hypothetical protein